ncbi:glucose / Sorbosone dehydrogenase family protein [Mycobacterium xenopi 4042]|uniref:Glucose / Sorbosone dehydrogenase family protein n=1 Tax=Mycobacterium xenopi 4042 TaxID=1299334 RepID=X7Z5X2_MYCXE|nr:glucose / Sorbosone dehydrogenase family protein [Mycobacterium xenopi 4042]
MLVSSGCARFNDAQSQPFTTEPQRRPPATSTPPPPRRCRPNRSPSNARARVMQGCLESTSGLIMLPDSKSALVAERTTGAVKEVSVSAEPKVKTVIPVDPSGDGGLMDIVLSPTYSQDRLMYAYVSTPSDNRVIRIADGDVPKDILTGIPKGATGNTGALHFTSKTTLVVLTGDAGNPAAAGDPASLAGKVIRIEQPTTINQAPPTTALTGIGAGGGLCTDPVDGSLYVLDRAPTADRLQRIARDSRVSTVWTWPDRPVWPDAPRWTAPSWSTWSTPSRRWPSTWRRRPARSPAHPRWSARTPTPTPGRCGWPGRQRLGRDDQQDRGRRGKARRRGLPVVPAGRRLPTHQRGQDLKLSMRARTTAHAAAKRST